MAHHRTIAYGFIATTAHLLLVCCGVYGQFTSTSEFITFCTNALVADPNANHLVDSSEFAALCTQLCDDSALYELSDGCEKDLEFHQLPPMFQIRFAQTTCTNIQPVNLAELCADDVVNGTSSASTAIYLGNPVASETMYQVRMFCGDVSQLLANENYIYIVDGGDPGNEPIPAAQPVTVEAPPTAVPISSSTPAPTVQAPVVPQFPTNWPSVGGPDSLNEVTVDNFIPTQPILPSPTSSAGSRSSWSDCSIRCWFAVCVLFVPLVDLFSY